jgi:hydrogenase maturation protein HypF
VALSGGVFQNAYLFEHLHEALEKRGFEVYTHREIPSNDACIALGQAYVAREWLLDGGKQLREKPF